MRLSNFDFAAVPSLTKVRLSALVGGQECLDRDTNVLAFGTPGAGEPHLVCGLVRAAIDVGQRELSTRCSDPEPQLRAARHNLHLPKAPAELDHFSTTSVRRDAERLLARLV